MRRLGVDFANRIDGCLTERAACPIHTSLIAKHKHIPAAERQPILQQQIESPREIRYPRSADLDPQLVWRGKDEPA